LGYKGYKERPSVKLGLPSCICRMKAAEQKGMQPGPKTNEAQA